MLPNEETRRAAIPPHYGFGSNCQYGWQVLTQYLQTNPGESLKKILKEALKIAQEEESDIGEVKKLVESGEKPAHKIGKSPTPPGTLASGMVQADG